MKKLWFALGLVLIISFGCISDFLSESYVDSTRDIALYPEKYEGQEVTILASQKYSIVATGLGLQYYTTIEDAEGNPIHHYSTYNGGPISLYLDYDGFDCKFYCRKSLITGTMRKIETCHCQLKTPGEWRETNIEIFSYMKIDICEEKTGESERRCDPDAENRYVYYLDVTSVE